MKHIRTLRLRGFTTTDPFETLEAERYFYENRYNPDKISLQKTISYALKIYLYQHFHLNLRL